VVGNRLGRLQAEDVAPGPVNAMALAVTARVWEGLRERGVGNHAMEISQRFGNIKRRNLTPPFERNPGAVPGHFFQDLLRYHEQRVNLELRSFCLNGLGRRLS